MQARHYDPVYVRFNSNDPKDFNVNNVFSFNRYAYGNGNPYKWTDPDGRDGACVYTNGCANFGNPNPTAVKVIGAIADFVPGVGDVKAVVEAAIDPSATNVVAAAVGVVPGVGDAAAKIIKATDKVADTGKAAGAAAARAENIAKGVPASQLGPSGKPKIHVVDHGGDRKSAKDAARQEVGKGGTTENHTSPAVGKDHYHGVDQSGEKSRVHHEYDR